MTAEADNNNSVTHHAIVVTIPMKRGELTQGVLDLSETGEGEIDIYKPKMVADEVINLLIAYINRKTKRGGYYRNVNDTGLKNIHTRFKNNLKSFCKDIHQRELIVSLKLYDDKGIEDDIQFHFKRCCMTIQK